MQTIDSSATPPVSALRDDGSIDATYGRALSDELAVALYEQMVLARHLDESLVALQREGRIASHATAIGEEAAIIGASAAMHDDDWIFLSAREMAAALWRGAPLRACAQTLFGTGQAVDKGRGGHVPPFWKPARVVSVSPLSGTQIPHAVGVAWAARLRRADVAALVFFGDGATSSGDFHAGLNFAGVTRAPLVAVCRNNGWAISTPASRQTASCGLAIKAIAYGMRGVRVDGNDVVAVLGVVREARARAAAGDGGTLIEAVTSTPPDGEGNGPPSDARLQWADRDPIARMQRHLRARGLSSPEDEAKLLEEVRADVRRAIEQAQAAAPPPPESLFDDVYAVRPWHLREQAALAAALGSGAGS